MNDKNKHTKINQAGKESNKLLDYASTGKKRAWVKYKRQSLAISKACGFFDELVKYAGQIFECGAWLRFASCSEKHYKRLLNATFCKCRLCVTCQWRKSLVIKKQLLDLIHAHKAQFSSDVPLLLTLTIPNVSGSQLTSSLDLITKAWKKLSERKCFTDSVRSWFRALEVTYNEERRDFHPHFHILLMVPEAYFKKDRGLYISHDEWLEMWRSVTGISEITQVDIRKIKRRVKGNSVEKLVAEVGKYATKPGSYIKRLPNNDFQANPDVVNVLHTALKGRRLVGFGGLFNVLRKRLKQEDAEEANLINISGDEQECLCPICKSTLIEELYLWDIGLKNYIVDTGQR